MSENFETGLNELYTRATAAHADGAGFPMASMVAVARRNRQRRTAAVAVATAAAVVGVGLGGAAAVRNLGDDAPVAPPAATPSPTGSGLVVEPACGTAIRDLAALDLPGLVPRVDAGLYDSEIASGDTAGAWVRYTFESGEDPAFQAQIPSDIGFLVARDGVVVSLGRTVRDAAADGGNGALGLALTPWACPDGAAQEDPLEEGDYEVYIVLPATYGLDVHTARGLLVSEPLPLTVGPAGSPTPQEPDGTEVTDPSPYAITHEVSALFTDGEPLADGDYIASVVTIDAAAGTVGADLMVWYSGQAAEDYVAANIPGGEVVNDYYLVNAVEQMTTLRLATDVSVYEWCFGEGDTPDLTHLVRTVPEWASAPHYDRAEAHLECAAGQLLDRGDLYWLRVRDGVVTAVTGQFVP